MRSLDSETTSLFSARPHEEFGLRMRIGQSSFVRASSCKDLEHQTTESGAIKSVLTMEAAQVSKPARPIGQVVRDPLWK